MRILAVSGSLQARSANLALLEVARANAPSSVEVVIFDGLRRLPPFDLDLEASAPVPAVEEWRNALSASDGLLIASPEYGFSLPGSLKNAIDWVIGSAELEGKVVAVTASVNHPERGRRGLASLLEPLRAVSATIVGGEPIVRGASFEQEVLALLAALVAAIQTERGHGGAQGPGQP
jgi:chromate reductase, NAD(P)H dehydrogenase (quinone)